MKLRFLSYLSVSALAGLVLASVSRSEDVAADAPTKDAAAVEGAVEKAVEPAAGRPFLGASVSEVPGFLAKHIGLEAGRGLLVRATAADGPAAAAGLEEDDVIVKANGTEVGRDVPLRKALEGLKPGDEAELEIIRAGKPLKLSVKLGESPQRREGAQADAADKDQAGGPGAEMEERLRQALEKARGMRLNIEPGEGGLRIIPPAEGEGGGGGFRLNLASDIRIADAEGTISVKKNAEGTRVRVLDREGKEQWSGPWDTEQDKAAAPPDIRERINRMNVNILPGGRAKNADGEEKD